MQRLIVVLFIGLVFARFSTLSFSQVRVPIQYERVAALRALSSSEPVRRINDTLRVLALMVEFQTDNDSRTSGDGRFQLHSTTARMSDPPPHDSLYFIYKLRFLENYFRKVSNGQLIIRGDVLGRITLPKVMSQYAPDGTNLKGLADLVVESWAKADSTFSTFPFASYDAFIVFHAGVGRDINLVSLLGYDPTPYDLPSIYLNLQALRKALNNSSFSGVPVSGEAFHIAHSMILPETETRVFSSGSQVDTLQLGMNGLLAASFGSFLGLPDLFDTQTGQSGIGQFGLMDGAGIFAYRGLFPPEPSAWEKVYLGWVTPIEVNSNTTLIVPAVGLTTTGRDTIYKIPISSKEYFLIENRNRDPQGNGQRLTIRENNSIFTRVFLTDSSNFRFDNVRGISGSVIDVEDFDWALIGRKELGYDFEGGGILIWHIDEERIQRGLATNSVNADPDRRGVDLEEADGSQDIGQAYEFLEPGDGSQSGSPLDPWFQGNIAPPYKNIFDGSSMPNSKSNAGARTLITLKDFNTRSPRMTVKSEIGDAQLSKIAALSRRLTPAGIANPPTITTSGIFVTAANRVYGFQPNGASKMADASGLISATGGQFPVAATTLSPGVDVLVGAQDSTVYLWTLRDLPIDGVYDSVATSVVQIAGKVSVPAMIADSSGTKIVVIGSETGKITRLSLDGSIRSTVSLSTFSVTSIASLPSGSGFNVVAASGGKVFIGGSSVTISDPSVGWILAAGVKANATMIVAAERGGKRVVGLDASLAKMFDIELGSGAISTISIADINADGNKDVLISSGGNLYALNKAGVILDGFPVSLSDGDEFVSSPLVADVDEAIGQEIIVLTKFGTLWCYNARGGLKGGFPLHVSAIGIGHLGLFTTASTKVGFLAVSDSGSMAGWELNRPILASPVVWGQHLRDAAHSNNNDAIEPSLPPVTEFFPKSKVYNWPNPVYGSTTQIRFFCSRDAQVNVKVFDLVGNKITELTGQAMAGIDSEITWDVSNIDSGVYLARVEAVAGGEADAAIIKIAVVK